MKIEMELELSIPFSDRVLLLSGIPRLFARIVGRGFLVRVGLFPSAMRLVRKGRDTRLLRRRGGASHRAMRCCRCASTLRTRMRGGGCALWALIARRRSGSRATRVSMSSCPVWGRTGARKCSLVGRGDSVALLSCCRGGIGMGRRRIGPLRHDRRPFRPLCDRSGVRRREPMRRLWDKLDASATGCCGRASRIQL